jgi:hypothetical protein
VTIGIIITMKMNEENDDKNDYDDDANEDNK